jgi:hypothetical protein
MEPDRASAECRKMYRDVPNGDWMNPQSAVYTMDVSQPEDKKSFRVDMKGELKERWEAMLANRKISQVDAIDALFSWIVGQEDIVQAMVLGQLPPSVDLLRVIFARTEGLKMGATAGGKATTTATGSRSSESTPRSSQGREKRYVQRDAAGAFVEPGQSREQKRKPRV